MSDPQSPVDDLGLSGKVAIVTGGGAPDDGIGNGRAAAMLLARAGARVLVVDIVSEAAAQTVAMIAQEGGSAAPFVADVADEQQCRAVVDEALARFGRLDLLDTMSGSAGAAASSTPRSRIGAGSCRSMSTACSWFRALRSRR
jgi:NAD(P)-dependent dehydrogenase (short-subunit alcohol dehydrogenase family)